MSQAEKLHVIIAGAGIGGSAARARDAGAAAAADARFAVFCARSAFSNSSSVSFFTSNLRDSRLHPSCASSWLRTCRAVTLPRSEAISTLSAAAESVSRGLDAGSTGLGARAGSAAGTGGEKRRAK